MCAIHEIQCTLQPRVLRLRRRCVCKWKKTRERDVTTEYMEMPVCHGKRVGFKGRNQ